MMTTMVAYDPQRYVHVGARYMYTAKWKLSSQLHFISSTIPHVHVLSIGMHKYTYSKETQLAGLHVQSQSKSRVQGSNLDY